jgi:segregation and condensation protein B
VTEAIVTFPDPNESGEASAADREAFRQQRLSLLEAVIFAAEDPPTLDQLAQGLDLPRDLLESDLNALCESYGTQLRGVEIRAVGGGYRMSTKAEHHEAVRAFVKTVRPKLRLSKAALETLAVVAYRQPVTLPEIQAIRGVVSASGVIHTLLGHKLITTAGRKKIVGRPMRYKTTDEFLLRFGLKDLSELPTLKEMEALSRAALDEDDQVAAGSDEE